jgi:UDP-N-acetylmuramoyl-tripeptide--D-alanyl-D-alanine ligase
MLNLEAILKASGGREICAGATSFSGISIDSRTIREGELFVALKGERFDGHDFLEDALGKGAGVIMNRDALCAKDRDGLTGGLRITDRESGRTIIAVEDTLRALHDIARYLRVGFKGHVLGVVGSNGKTTTKEMLSAVVGTRMKTLKTAGNFNNNIGMPLSMTRLESDTEAMVLEMGANRPGDIGELCGIALPDIGVVTNIGSEHLAGFGSMDKVRESELEILPYVKKIVLNADDRFLLEGIGPAYGNERITFGIEKEDADIVAGDIAFIEDGTRFLLSTPAGETVVNSRLHGLFNVYNSLAAAAAASAMGFHTDDIKSGLESFVGVDMRFRIKNIGGITLLDDVYNANPSSMEASIKELIRLFNARTGEGAVCHENARAIAVLGDMLELGQYEVDEHRKLGRLLSSIPVEIFIGVGPLMKNAVQEYGKAGIWVQSPLRAAEALEGLLRDGDIILVKGSRGMRMEKVHELMGKGGRANAV